jgi:hypothetical protein
VAFNIGRSPSFVFPNGPQPQLPASHRNSSQLISPSSPLSNSESESESLYDCQFTANQFVLATSPLKLTTSIFSTEHLRYNPYATSSLTRGWVCRLQLPLVFASAVILVSESHGVHDHILLSQIRDSSNLEGQVPVSISPRNRVAH